MAPVSHAMLPVPRLDDAGAMADARLAAFAAELDALKAKTMAQVGERDARYVVALLWAIRGQ